MWRGIVAWEEANSRVIPLGKGTLESFCTSAVPYALRCRAIFCPISYSIREWALPRWCYPRMGSMVGGGCAGRISTNQYGFINSPKNKEPDRNDNYYDRWFVIQGVDDDKPLSKMSPFAVDKALKCAVETVKSIKCLRSGDLLVEVSDLAACSFPTFLLGPWPVNGDPEICVGRVTLYNPSGRIVWSFSWWPYCGYARHCS